MELLVPQLEPVATVFGALMIQLKTQVLVYARAIVFGIQAYLIVVSRDKIRFSVKNSIKTLLL